MAVRFTSLDALFQSCTEHLDQTNSWNTQIENYFVQLLLIHIWAEYQVRITSLVEKRGARSNDDQCLNFVGTCLKDVCKHIKIADLTGIAGRFDEQYKKLFTIGLSNEQIQAWNDINTNRQNVAHRLGTVGLTLPELKRIYEKSIEVFDVLIEVLELKAKELKGLR